MTTGTTGSNTGANYNFRDWSGQNGKYELVGSSKRVKWNNYTMSRMSHRATMDTVRKSNYCSVDAVFNTIASIPAEAQVAVQAKIVESIKQHDFNAAVFTATMPQTVDLVVNAVRTVGGAMLDLKRGRLASAARRLGVNEHTSKLSHKDVAGRWLELQYGWLPLLSDVKASMDAFAAIQAPPRTVILKESVVRNSTYNGSTSPSNWTGYGTIRRRITIQYELTEKLPAPRSLGLTDPLSVAWELLPWSFVLDWFIPIGTFLSNLNVIPQLDGRSLTTIVNEFHVPNITVLNNLYYSGCTASFDGVAVSRQVTKGIPLALPSFKTLSQAASAKHVLNAIALASQNLSK